MRNAQNANLFHAYVRHVNEQIRG